MFSYYILLLLTYDLFFNHPMCNAPTYNVNILVNNVKINNSFVSIAHHVTSSANRPVNMGIEPSQSNRAVMTYLALFLITISNDVRMNPGPVSHSATDSIYPCGTCDRPVTWEDRGIVCDTCNQWYHVTCQSMCSGSYDKHVNDSAIAWDSLACNSPNYTTLCYSMVFSTSNHFSVLSDAPLDSPTWQPTPIHASTPVKITRPRAMKKKQHLRILNVNFQIDKNETTLTYKSYR